MSPDKLTYMANQIGMFFRHKPHDLAVAAIADHLTKFWDPRMLKVILGQLDSNTAHLDPLVHKAVEQIREAQLS